MELTETEVNLRNRNMLNPPDANLKLTYVVPIKGEVENGNIFHQLKDFTRQNTDPNNFELIYVVNNTDQDKQSNNQPYQENQQLLSIFKYISGFSDTPPPDLEEWQERIVTSARNKGVHIQALDLSTSGLEEKNIEKARIIGDNLAIDRFQQTKAKGSGAIVVMDADTRVGRQVSSQIIDQLVNNPKLGMLRFPYDKVPGEGGKGLFKTTSQERFTHNVTYFKDLLQWHAMGTWYAIKAKALGQRDPRPESYLLAIMRDNLQPNQGQVAAANNIRVYTQDRARKANQGGLHGKARHESLSISQDDYSSTDPTLELITSIHYHLKKTNHLTPKINTTLTSIIKDNINDPQTNSFIDTILLAENPPSDEEYNQFTEFLNRQQVIASQYAKKSFLILSRLLEENQKEYDELESIVRDEVRREKLRHALISEIVDHTLNKVYQDGSNTQLSPENIHQYITDKPGRKTAATNFVNNNPWIIEVLNDVRDEAHSPQQARQLLNQQFPELLLPFDDTEYTWANAVISGLSRFVEKVSANPKDFSHASTLLGLRETNNSSESIPSFFSKVSQKIRRVRRQN